MTSEQLIFNHDNLDQPSTRNPQAVKISPSEAFDVMTRFDEIGFWRAELDSGLVYWTQSVFNIYGMEPTDGAVNIVDAINAYHPEDRETVLKCVEEASRLKTGYRFVLRLLRPDGEVVWVKSHAMHRVSDDGKDELYGYIERFSPRARSVTILK